MGINGGDKGFRGPDPERARYYPEDEEYLLGFEPTVEHFEVLAGTRERRTKLSGPLDCCTWYEDEARRQEWAAGLDPLAARLADGDPLAPEALVERHYRELYRYAFSVLREERPPRMPCRTLSSAPSRRSDGTPRRGSVP